MGDPTEVRPRGSLSRAESAVLDIAMMAALEAVPRRDLPQLARSALGAIAALPATTPLSLIADRLGHCAEGWTHGAPAFPADFHLRRACAEFWSLRFVKSAWGET